MATNAIHQEQGTLLLPDTNGHELFVAHEMFDGGGARINLHDRKVELLKTLDLVSLAGSHVGLVKGQHSEAVVADLHEKIDPDTLSEYNANMLQMHDVINGERREDRIIRYQFRKATGYEAVNTRGPKRELTDAQKLGNQALSTFLKTYRGESGKIERLELREKLDPESSLRPVIRSTKKVKKSDKPTQSRPRQLSF